MRKPQLPAAQRQTKLSAFTQPKSKQPDPAPVPSRADRAAQGPEGAKVAELAAAVDVEGEEGKFGDEELAAAARDMGLTRCEFQGAGNEKATRSLKEAVLFYESFLDEVVVALPKLLSFCEWNTECQAELETLACGIEQNTCIFTDIAQFFRPELYEVLEELKKKPSMAVEVLSPLLAAQSAMRRKAHCARHSKLCFIGTARMHTAGSSCTAHSKQGKQLGLADPNVLHLLAWIGLRLEVQEYEISLENVESFPSHILERLLGKYYVIESQVMDPRMFGNLGSTAKQFLQDLFSSQARQSLIIASLR
ncbi:unnamed protein product [Effrenium voratum]|uniref:Uncharacterized protein n=1 Tax=Effrenium voratum TaxID=2562239 RepID=A0AA36J9S6_9DINO|nr:unnamed protein product [Effrenium voratum]